MREFEITRVQFHDIFVDYSYMQPVVTTIMRQAAEYAQYEKDEAKGDKAVPVSTSEVDKAAAAIAAKKALEYDVAAVISQLKGLHDHNFNMFLATAAVPSHRFFLSSLPKSANFPAEATTAGTAKKHDAMARIRIVDVFIVLAIMCKGVVAHKLAFIYHLFHDSYPWELEKVSSDVWLLSRNPFCIADSTRISLRVDQVVEMMMSIVNAMRRIGMSVADVPLYQQNPERAMASLPKAGALSAVLTGQNSRGAKRFRAAVDLITKAARSGLLPQLLKAKSPSARNLWSDPPTFSVPRVGNMLQLVQSAQTADALKKLLQGDESRPLTPGSAAVAENPIATSSLRTVSSRQFGESARSPESTASNPRAGIITEQGSSTGTKLDQTAFVRLEKMRLLLADGLDDDSPNSNAFVMVKKVMDCEDAASRGTDGHGISHKSVFRAPPPKGLRQPTLGDLSSLSPATALMSPRERNAAIESVFVPPSDSCWLLGLVLTMTESPERWRRLSAPKRKIVFNTPVGRTMRASGILLDYYVQSIEHVTQLAVDLVSDVSNAHAYLATDHTDPLSAVDSFDAVPVAPAVVRRETTLRGPTLKRLSSGQFDSPSIPTSESTLHLFQQATKSLDRYTALTRQNIPLTLLMDWYISHPIPRYIIRQFHYSLGKIATYEGMNCEAPPADSRHARSLASESFQSTTDITVILGRLAFQAGLDVYSLRELRDLCEPQCDDSMTMPYEDFCALLPPFLERLASARHQASLAWHEMPKGEITKPAPRVPKYYTMTEIARKRLAKNLLACADLHGVGQVNVAEFIVQLLRVTQGEAKEKLMLLFDVYDPDHDMQVTLRELGAIILGALRVSDLSEHAASFEKRQDDIEFSHELACGLDVNGDGNISREEFLVTISKVPIMYECFATALNLPIGEGDARQEPTALAKSGPVFDFVMLRLIRDNYSIDIAKNRGVAANDGYKKEKHKKRGASPRVQPQGEGDAEPAVKGKPTSILDRAVDRHHFRRLLRDVWKCPDDALYLSDRVFDYMDGDGSGSIDVRELYFGITAALRGSIEHRAEFFYHLFDVEGTGHLKSEEILRMLTASAGSDIVSEDDANAILNAIDSDGSGTVEREEFLAAVHLDPGILDSLSRVFGRQGGNLAGRFKGSEYDEEENEHDTRTDGIRSPSAGAMTTKPLEEGSVITPAPSDADAGGAPVVVTLLPAPKLPRRASVLLSEFASFGPIAPQLAAPVRKNALKTISVSPLRPKPKPKPTSPKKPKKVVVARPSPVTAHVKREPSVPSTPATKPRTTTPAHDARKRSPSPQAAPPSPLKLQRETAAQTASKLVLRTEAAVDRLLTAMEAELVIVPSERSPHRFDRSFRRPMTIGMHSSPTGVKDIRKSPPKAMLHYKSEDLSSQSGARVLSVSPSMRTSSKSLVKRPTSKSKFSVAVFPSTSSNQEWYTCDQEVLKQIASHLSADSYRNTLQLKERSHRHQLMDGNSMKGFEQGASVPTIGSLASVAMGPMPDEAFSLPLSVALLSSEAMPKAEPLWKQHISPVVTKSRAERFMNKRIAPQASRLASNAGTTALMSSPIRSSSKFRAAGAAVLQPHSPMR